MLKRLPIAVLLLASCGGAATTEPATPAPLFCDDNSQLSQSQATTFRYTWVTNQACCGTYTGSVALSHANNPRAFYSGAFGCPLDGSGQPNCTTFPGNIGHPWSAVAYAQQNNNSMRINLDTVNQWGAPIDFECVAFGDGTWHCTDEIGYDHVSYGGSLVLDQPSPMQSGNLLGAPVHCRVAGHSYTGARPYTMGVNSLGGTISGTITLTDNGTAYPRGDWAFPVSGGTMHVPTWGIYYTGGGMQLYTASGPLVSGVTPPTWAEGLPSGSGMSGQWYQSPYHVSPGLWASFTLQ